MYEYLYSLGVVPNLSRRPAGRFLIGRIAHPEHHPADGGAPYCRAGGRARPGLIYLPQTGLLATDAALALRVHAEAMDNTAQALERTAANFSRDRTELRGVVRVAASEVVGAEVLPPLVARLRQACPNIVIELMLSNRFQDLLHREADIAVRMVAPQQEQLIARRLGRIELGLHATAAYLTRQGLPATLDDLASHALIGFDSATPLVRRPCRLTPDFSAKRSRCGPIATSPS